jgi:hypothetical protein
MFLMAMPPGYALSYAQIRLIEKRVAYELTQLFAIITARPSGWARLSMLRLNLFARLAIIVVVINVAMGRRIFGRVGVVCGNLGH